MTALVKRDRNHASVIWWSFCNEAGCGDGRTEPALDFRLASYENDGSRYVGANMGWLSPMTPTNMSDLLGECARAGVCECGVWVCGWMPRVPATAKAC